MSSTVIRVEELGKRYRLGERESYPMLRDALANFLRPLLRARPQKDPPGSFWALQDVSFDVEQGEVVGIIGRNGAGKSTLLKVLSRITRPTVGCAKWRGRTGSLLEVGTGFHPELTGRENIYLNGAILGMTRADIEAKFDEIVAFAEVEQFLETPVKRYSSGMYVRLAFAVAAHLEPEILIIDEVLAVGDAEFQKKCLGKMEDVAHEGRTVLFVSHNMSTVQRLCSRTLLLEGGRLVASGNTARIVESYLAGGFTEGQAAQWLDLDHVERRGNGQVKVTSLFYTADAARIGHRPYPGGPLELAFEVQTDAARSVGSFAATIYDRNGTKLVNADTVTLGQNVDLRAGSNVVRLRLQALHLNPGVYTLGWWVADPFGRVFDYVTAGIDIEVVPVDLAGGGVLPANNGLVPCTFELVQGS